jgi:hypothetical protein
MPQDDPVQAVSELLELEGLVAQDGIREPA